MKYWKLGFALLLLPAFAAADLTIDGVSGIARWYFHADFVEMRNTESGKLLYEWLDDEVFAELEEETGLDIGKDLDSLVAQSDNGEEVVVVLSGNIRQEYQDQIMALAATQNLDLAPRNSGGKRYYYVEGEQNGDESPFDDGAYFTFALKDRVVLTSSEDEMQKLLANGTRLVVRRANTMVMFNAENAAVGSSTDAPAEWDSNIMKNTEEASVTIADDAGKFRLQAELITTAAEMAESLASVVRGLISLQAFNDDIEPEIAEILKTTKVDVRDRTLAISLSVDAKTVVNEL